MQAMQPPYKGVLAVMAGMTWARAAIFWGSDCGKVRWAVGRMLVFIYTTAITSAHACTTHHHDRHSADLPYAPTPPLSPATNPTTTTTIELIKDALLARGVEVGPSDWQLAAP